MQYLGHAFAVFKVFGVQLCDILNANLQTGRCNSRRLPSGGAALQDFLFKLGFCRAGGCNFGGGL